MKKIELNITPLDNAIADFENAIEQIDTQQKIDELEYSTLNSAEQIQEQLTDLSAMMESLQALLQKDIAQVKADQAPFEIVEETRLTRKKYRDEIKNK